MNYYKFLGMIVVLICIHYGLLVSLISKAEKFIHLLDIINDEVLNARREVHYCREVNERILNVLKTDKISNLSDEELLNAIKDGLDRYREGLNEH